MAPLAGGVLAAGIGAAVALWAFPQGLGQGPDLAPLDVRLAALEAESRPAPVDLSPLQARLDALESAPPADPGLAARLAALEGAAPANLSEIEARLAALEARPATGAPGPAPDLSRLDALEAALPALVARAVADATAEARETLDARDRDIAAAQARAGAVAALGELTRAAETGAPAGAALDRIAAVVDLPAGLDAFRTGLPTLTALQTDFPGLARSALAAAPPPDEAGTTELVMNFLRNQTGARSLSPREGTGTDAVLSRAQHALGLDDLALVLGEIDTLSPGPAAALAAWRIQAETRLVALTALAELSALLDQN